VRRIWPGLWRCHAPLALPESVLRSQVPFFPGKSSKEVIKSAEKVSKSPHAIVILREKV